MYGQKLLLHPVYTRVGVLTLFVSFTPCQMKKV